MNLQGSLREVTTVAKPVKNGQNVSSRFIPASRTTEKLLSSISPNAPAAAKLSAFFIAA